MTKGPSVRALKVLALTAFLLAATVPGVAAVTPPQPDPGCAAGWSYKVSHSWWIEKGQPFPGRHIHVGGCVPSHRTLTGSSVTLSGIIELHNDPGTLGYIRASWESTVVVKATINRRCATNCVIPWSLTVPFGGRTGWHELRLTANIGTNVFGDRQYQSTRYPMCLGTCSGGYSTHRTGMAGWYHDNYQNAYLDEASALRLEAGPVTGSLIIRAKGDGHRTIVALDANSHAGDPGIVLGSTTSTSYQSYTIPAGLPTGWHRLFVRTERDFSDGMSAGQGEFWFYVP
jgi:hypothetical protein